jgi:aryl-alcohol dehydrogenase-like predicted oxidoreductase
VEYIQFGRTGVRVSRFCIGTGNFGRYVDETESIRVMRFALDQGINFIDTADIYNNGVSEEYVGKAIEGRRDEVFLSSKAHSPVGTGPNDWGSSRRHIIEQVEKSLRRLGTDWIDLYQMHQADPFTPIDETLRALDDLVRDGKVRYIGSSNFAAWQIVESLWISDRLRTNQFISEQSQYSIMRRGPEGEQIAACRKYGSAFMGYSPLASGWLSGKFRRSNFQHGATGATSATSATGATGATGIDQGTKSRAMVGNHIGTEQGDRWLDIVERLHTIATDCGTSLPQFALAWAMRDPVVVPILGPRTDEHIATAIGALEINLDDDTLTRVDEVVPPSMNTR